jgi:pimeloyl-ACP methyl ester carboxylesterase
MAKEVAVEGEADQAEREPRGRRTPGKIGVTDRARGLPQSLRALIERFDVSVLDLPAREARIRLAVTEDGEWDLLLRRNAAEIRTAENLRTPDATLSADRATWASIASDLRGGMDAFRRGRLIVRRNLHLGVGFLAATSGASGPTRLRFEHVETLPGRISLLTAGTGEPVLLIHGLGATKGSFLPTIAALAESFRTIALDLPGFGDSYKPLTAPYHPPFFARAILDVLDALGLERAHLIGNSLGGRIALEVGLRHPERVGRIALLAPSLAWRRPRPWAPLVRVLRPELGVVQATPRWAVESVAHRILPVATSNWVRAGVDEFLRAYLTPRGRVAFYAAARQIYLEEPHGAKGFWTRLARLQPPALFIWGKRDWLVPIGFAAHVRDTLPAARHLELDCGHVPQLERPEEAHGAIAAFLRGGIDG